MFVVSLVNGVFKVLYESLNWYLKNQDKEKKYCGK